MLQSVSWLVLGRLLGDVFALVLYIALARTFGESGIGDYAFAFAIVVFLASVIEFGFGPLITRDLARRKYSTPEYAGKIIALQLVLTSFTSAILALLLYYSAYSYSLTIIIILAFGSTVFQSIGLSLGACLEAIEAMRKRSILEIVMRLTTTITGLILIGLRYPLHIVIASHVIGGALYLVVGFYWVRKQFGAIRLRIDLIFFRQKLREALPFVGQSTLYLLYTRIDIMMLHYLADDVQTGRYAAVMRLLMATLLLPTMVGVAIYPRLSRADQISDAERRVLFLTALRWLALIGAGGAVVFVVAGGPIVLLLFGPKFREATVLMPWLAILLFAGFARVPYERLLLANSKEGTLFRIDVVALIINVIVNAVLIPRWGAPGAVWASVASQIFVLGALHRHGARMVVAPYTTGGGRLLVGAVCGLAVGVACEGVTPWPVTAGLALLGLLVVAVLLGLITTEDRRILRGAGGSAL